MFGYELVMEVIVVSNVTSTIVICVWLLITIESNNDRDQALLNEKLTLVSSIGVLHMEIHYQMGRQLIFRLLCGS